MTSRVLLLLAAGAVALAGCSLANTPDEPVEPETGGGGTGGSGGAACTDDCTTLSDACNEGACVSGTCVAQPRQDGLSCDDGLYCTINDSCQAGTCEGEALDCPANGACTQGVCDEDADNCVVAPADEGAACDDGDPCTDESTCVSGSCASGPEVCDQLDTECSVGFCDPNAGCATMPANEGGACDTANPCAQSSCVSGMCTVITIQNEGLDCEDGAFCTFGDSCQMGVCMPGTAAACPESGMCGTWTCDEANDTCMVTPQNDGQICDDGNACTPTSLSQCNGGQCIVPLVNGPKTYLWEDFGDNSAGWALGPEWQIGPAMMSSGGTPGADPATDHTPTSDNGVAGVLIGGIVTPDPHPYHYITSPPMNVQAGEIAILGFYRWLNSDYDPFMHNTVEVWDGQQWVVVWISGPPPEVSDSAWTYIEHDLSMYANPGMRVRFGYDIAQSGAYSAPSWNIDDVLISSLSCP